MNNIWIKLESNQKTFDDKFSPFEFFWRDVRLMIGEFLLLFSIHLFQRERLFSLALRVCTILWNLWRRETMKVFCGVERDPSEVWSPIKSKTCMIGFHLIDQSNYNSILNCGKRSNKRDGRTWWGWG
ncbi:hypothetical protein IC582_005585 [Cucumis melo]